MQIKMYFVLSLVKKYFMDLWRILSALLLRQLCGMSILDIITELKSLVNKILQLKLQSIIRNYVVQLGFKKQKVISKI